MRFLFGGWRGFTETAALPPANVDIDACLLTGRSNGVRDQSDVDVTLLGDTFTNLRVALRVVA